MSELKEKGFKHFQIDIPVLWRELLNVKDYQTLDQEAGKFIGHSGPLYSYIRDEFPDYFEKSQNGFEYIISVRKGPQDIDEDGIWHDDGSRLLAFSLSLNLEPNSIHGGELLFRARSSKENTFSLETRPFGTLTVFATGQDGWEHKTSLVHNGTRVIMAGWLS
jgi:hypothetical protein